MKKAILINDTSTEYHLGSAQVVKIIKQYCKKNGIQIIKKFTRKRIRECKLSDINAVDLVIINGEGSLHHHPRKNTQWLLDFLTLAPKDAKIVLINTLWQAMQKIKNIESYLDKVNLISVRESLSYKDLLSMYPHPEKIIITPDIIFATQTDKLNKIGFGDSVHYKLRQSLKKNNNFFPLSYIDKGRYSHIEEILMPSFQTYLIWLKSLDLYITGRFHGLCLSALMGTPFLALASNSHKIQAILEDMKCSELLITDVKESENKKQQAIESLPKIHKYVQEAKKKIEVLFERIAQL